MIYDVQRREWQTNCVWAANTKSEQKKGLKQQIGANPPFPHFTAVVKYVSLCCCSIFGKVTSSQVHEEKYVRQFNLICLVKEELCRFFSQLLLAAIIHVSVTKQTTREENNHFPAVTHQCVNWSQWRSFLSARRLNFSFYFNPIARINVGTYGVLAFLQSSENFVLLIWLS